MKDLTEKRGARGCQVVQGAASGPGAAAQGGAMQTEATETLVLPPPRASLQVSPKLWQSENSCQVRARTLDLGSENLTPSPAFTPSTEGPSANLSTCPSFSFLYQWGSSDLLENCEAGVK